MFLVETEMRCTIQWKRSQDRRRSSKSARDLASLLLCLSKRKSEVSVGIFLSWRCAR